MIIQCTWYIDLCTSIFSNQATKTRKDWEWKKRFRVWQICVYTNVTDWHCTILNVIRIKEKVWYSVKYKVKV